MADELFFLTNEKYSSGFVLNEYKDEFSLIAAREGKNGSIFQQWGDLEVGKDKTKRLPVAIRLGDRATAIQVLREVLGELEGEGGRSEPPPIDDEDVPF